MMEQCEHTMDNVLVTVSSNACLTEFPENTPYNFRNRLPWSLPGRCYEIGLVQIQVKPKVQSAAVVEVTNVTNESNTEISTETENNQGDMPTPTKVPRVESVKFFERDDNDNVVGNKIIVHSRLSVDLEVKKLENFTSFLQKLNNLLTSKSQPMKFETEVVSETKVVKFSYTPSGSEEQIFRVVLPADLVQVFGFGSHVLVSGTTYSSGIDLAHWNTIPDKTSLPITLETFYDTELEMKEPSSLSAEDILGELRKTFRDSKVKVFVLPNFQTKTLLIRLNTYPRQILSVKLPEVVNSYLRLPKNFVFDQYDTGLVLDEAIFKEQHSVDVALLNKKKTQSEIDIERIFVCANIVPFQIFGNDAMQYVYTFQSTLGKEGEVQQFNPQTIIYLPINAQEVREIEISLLKSPLEYTALEENSVTVAVFHLRLIG